MSDPKTSALRIRWRRLLIAIAAIAGMFVLVVKSECPKPGTVDPELPNLAEVESGLWRSGQPTSDKAWSYLASRGVKTVVKLNFDEEGTDEGALAAGMTLIRLPIPPKGDLASVFERPDPKAVMKAVGLAGEGGGVLVHCTHGQDRTGLVIGMTRVLHDGWSPGDAYKEMLEHGFHPELVGLQGFWEDFRESYEREAGAAPTSSTSRWAPCSLSAEPPWRTSFRSRSR